MSEWLNFDYEPYMTIPTTEGDKRATPENTIIFLHQRFEDRGCDHLFIQTGETEEQFLGAFVFRICSDEMMDNFDVGVQELIENGFPVIYADEVDPGDRAQFERTVETFVGRVSIDDLEKPWEVTSE